MANKLTISEEADVERAKLPPNLLADLDQRLSDLFDHPGAPGTVGRDRVEGVSIDGSRFEVDVSFEWFENELLIGAIDISAY